MPESEADGALSPLAPRNGMAGLLPRLALPTYLAAVLTQAEEALIARDVALLANEEGTARDHEELVAGLLCVALTRAVDEFRMPPDVVITAAQVDFLQGKPLPTELIPNLTLDVFREQELHLLRLVGLSHGLAIAHLDAAFAAVTPQAAAPVRSVADLTEALEAAVEAACTTHQAIVRKRRAAEDRRWRGKVTRRCVLAAGGVLIVVANTAAALFIGPLGVAASAALGGGAAGAAANLIEG